MAGKTLIEIDLDEVKGFVNLNEQRENGVLCDVELVSAENLVFYAHRCVLAARSEYFSRMFTRRLHKVVKLDDSADIIEEILNYIYGGVIYVTKDSTNELLLKSAFYGIPDLFSAIEDHIAVEIDKDNCLHLAGFSYSVNAQKLHSVAVKFIAKNLAVAAVAKYEKLEAIKMLKLSSCCILSEAGFISKFCDWFIHRKDMKTAGQILDKIPFGKLDELSLRRIHSVFSESLPCAQVILKKLVEKCMTQLEIKQFVPRAGSYRLKVIASYDRQLSISETCHLKSELDRPDQPSFFVCTKEFNMVNIRHELGRVFDCLVWYKDDLDKIFHYTVNDFDKNPSLQLSFVGNVPDPLSIAIYAIGPQYGAKKQVHVRRICSQIGDICLFRKEDKQPLEVKEKDGEEFSITFDEEQVTIKRLKLGGSKMWCAIFIAENGLLVRKREVEFSVGLSEEKFCLKVCSDVTYAVTILNIINGC